MVSIVVIVASTPPSLVLVGPFVGIRAPIVVAHALSVPCIVPLTEALVVVVVAIMALTLVALVAALIVAHRVM